MKKNFLLGLLMLFACIEISAVPALRVKKQLTLEDGTIVTATLQGDEYYGYYITDDGKVLAPILGVPIEAQLLPVGIGGLIVRDAFIGVVASAILRGAVLPGGDSGLGHASVPCLQDFLPRHTSPAGIFGFNSWRCHMP